MLCRRLLIAVTLAAASVTGLGGQAPEPATIGWSEVQRTPVLLLGTYHFRSAGRDAYAHRHEVDVLTPAKQAEVGKVVDRLAEFAPTRIAVEVRTERQPWLDSLYAAYRAGAWVLEANEIFQLGFRLADRLGHERVYAVDAPARSFFDGLTRAGLDSITAGLPPIDPAWDQRYRAWYEWKDSLKTVLPLDAYLHYLNDPETIRRAHGHYLVSDFRLRGRDDYFGADFATYWWNRNLRIFSNLQRLPRAAGERILVIIGSGHLPLLRHAVSGSPEYELVEAQPYLE